MGAGNRPNTGKGTGHRLALAFSIEGGGECSAHGCWIGVKGGGYLTRYGRPAHRAALAGRRGRAVLAGRYEAIPFVGPLLDGPAVSGAALIERAGNHREHAPRA